MEINKNIGKWYIPKEGDEKLDYILDVIYQLYINDWFKGEVLGINPIESQANLILYYYQKEKGKKWGMIEYDMKYYDDAVQLVRREKIEKILSRGDR